MCKGPTNKLIAYMPVGLSPAMSNITISASHCPIPWLSNQIALENTSKPIAVYYTAMLLARVSKISFFRPGVLKAFFFRRQRARWQQTSIVYLTVQYESELNIGLIFWENARD